METPKGVFFAYDRNHNPYEEDGLGEWCEQCQQWSKYPPCTECGRQNMKDAIDSLVRDKEIEGFWDDKTLQWIFIPTIEGVEKAIKNGKYKNSSKAAQERLRKNALELQNEWKDKPKYSDYVSGAKREEED